MIAAADQRNPTAGGAEVHLVRRRHVLDHRQGPLVGRGGAEGEHDVARELERQVDPDPTPELGRPGPDQGDHGARLDLAPRRPDVDDAVAAAQQAADRALALDHRAEAPRGLEKAHCREIGVGVARARFVADRRHVLERQQRMTGPGLLPRDRQGLGALARLARQIGPQLVRGLTLAAEDQIAAIDEAAVGLVVLEVVREVAEDLEALEGELGVGGDRVVGAKDGAGFGGAAAADLPALEQRHAAGAELGEVERDGGAHHAAADHHHVVGFSHVGPAREASMARQPGDRRGLSGRRDNW